MLNSEKQNTNRIEFDKFRMSRTIWRCETYGDWIFPMYTDFNFIICSFRHCFLSDGMLFRLDKCSFYQRQEKW